MPSTKKKKRTATKLPPLLQQVQGQLDSLSLSLEEAARQYVKRMQREIYQIRDAVTEAANAKNTGDSPAHRTKRLRELSELLASVHIKTQKGRRKDLKRIDELIGLMESLTAAD